MRLIGASRGRTPLEFGNSGKLHNSKQPTHKHRKTQLTHFSRNKDRRAYAHNAKISATLRPTKYPSRGGTALPIGL